MPTPRTLGEHGRTVSSVTGALAGPTVSSTVGTTVDDHTFTVMG
jgi:hypothetical protein